MNLFGDSDYLEKLSLKGDPLERQKKWLISSVVAQLLTGFLSMI